MSSVSCSGCGDEEAFPQRGPDVNHCTECQGKFGLIRQRWYGYQFCSKRCQERFLKKLAERKQAVRGWLAYLRQPTEVPASRIETDR